MHEMSIVQTLLEQIEAEVKGAGCTGPARRVRLVVGRLAGVHVDSLRFAFELLRSGTVAESAELDIDQPRAQLVCQDCAAVQPTDELAASCPRCGSARVRIEGGRELLLQSIEVDDEDDGT